jgi:hypothetical protein
MQSALVDQKSASEVVQNAASSPMRDARGKYLPSAPASISTRLATVTRKKERSEVAMGFFCGQAASRRAERED